MHRPIIAVLTGDLVESTRFPAESVEAGMLSIRHTAETITRSHTPPKGTRFTRFRGDGWQICLTEPHLSLRTAVLVQAALAAQGLETRISIGIGAFNTLGTTDLSDAAGPAFELSGRGLDGMGSQVRIAIDGAGIAVQDQLIADLLGERMSRWTAAQAQAVSLHLAAADRKTLHDIGQTLHISPQAVNDRVRGAGSQVIASVLRRWEQMPGRNPWRAEA